MNSVKVLNSVLLPVFALAASRKATSRFFSSTQNSYKVIGRDNGFVVSSSGSSSRVSSIVAVAAVVDGSMRRRKVRGAKELVKKKTACTKSMCTSKKRKE